MIVDVNIIVPNKVVEVTFTDGSKQKSVCKEPDVFNLEQAISICITKQIMGGSSKYNRLSCKIQQHDWIVAFSWSFIIEC